MRHPDPTSTLLCLQTFSKTMSGTSLGPASSSRILVSSMSSPKHGFICPSTAPKTALGKSCRLFGHDPDESIDAGELTRPISTEPVGLTRLLDVTLKLLVQLLDAPDPGHQSAILQPRTRPLWQAGINQSLVSGWRTICFVGAQVPFFRVGQQSYEVDGQQMPLPHDLDFGRSANSSGKMWKGTSYRKEADGS